MSAIRAIFTSWFSSLSTSQADIDMEAQTIASVPLPTQSSLPSPAPAHLSSHRVQLSHSQEEGTTDAIDDFFGVTHTRRSGSQDSQHANATPSSSQLEAGEEVAPPPYAEASDLPSYTAVADPHTLAMYLFKFGFLFPIFWLAGIIILLSPLSAPEGWEPTKSEAERQELIALLRKTERKWAKRCLVAFLVFASIVLVITLAAVLVMRT